jgi:hypothetical protein
MLLSEKKFNRLTASVDWSARQMEFPRNKRIEAARQLCGHHHSADGSPKVVPVNLIKLAVDIYVRQLAARSPRVLVTTADQAMKSVAANLEIALNLIPAEINLTETLRRVVMEALFSFGVVKIGLHTIEERHGYDYGDVFVDSVSFDDYFLDMSARHMDLIQYEGNDYWVSYEELMDSRLFPRKHKDTIRPDSEGIDDAYIGERGERRAEMITRDGSADMYERRVWLRDMWLPHEKAVLTYAVKSKTQLRMVDWNGPENGPYRKLGFTDVPGSLLPLSPMSAWRDLHDLANALFRKLSNQADNQKSVLGFTGENDDEVRSFQTAKDGDGIHYQGTKPETLTAGGVNANTLAYEEVVRSMFSYFGGNIDALGGLAPMTETVGQDKLLTESASAQMRDMAGRTIDFVKAIFTDLAFYEWNDPIKKRMLEKPVPGIQGMSIPVVWDSRARKGNLESMNIDIDVYSLQDNSPGVKLQRMGFIMQQYVLPLLPEIARQGGSVDTQTILSLVAKYADFPELTDIVTFTEPVQQSLPDGQAGGTQQGQGRGASTGAPQGGAASDILQQVLSQGRTVENA